MLPCYFAGFFVFNPENILPGDLNNDTDINVLDVIILVNMIIDGADYINLADLNFDENIDILDIVLLVNIILDS